MLIPQTPMVNLQHASSPLNQGGMKAKHMGACHAVYYMHNVFMCNY